MNSELADLLAFLRGLPDQKDLSIEERRLSYDRAERAMPLPPGIVTAPWTQGALRGQMLTGAASETGRMLLFVHGGGFQCGSSRSHRHLAAAIAAAARSDALVLDYRLAPEHPFPAGIDDTLAAYRHLLGAWPAAKLALVGDSAGGGLIVSALAAARDLGDPMPAALCCLSPWVDLTCRAPTPTERALIDDPLTNEAMIAPYVAAYLGDAPPTHRLATPIGTPLNGFPPTLIQVGSAEWLRRDSVALAETLAAHDVEVTLEIEPEPVPHVWQWYWPRLQLARDAIARIGRFLDTRLA